MTDDPTRIPGRWDALFELQRQMDDDIETLYRHHGVTGMRPRFVRPLLRLKHEGPMTISALARSLGAGHSATSQTVAALKRAGFVSSRPGSDGRTQVLTLTPEAREMIPLLDAEWRATEAVVAALDDELGGAVTALSQGLGRALATRSMSARLEDELRRQA